MTNAQEGPIHPLEYALIAYFLAKTAYHKLIALAVVLAIFLEWYQVLASANVNKDFMVLI